MTKHCAAWFQDDPWVVGRRLSRLVLFCLDRVTAALMIATLVIMTRQRSESLLTWNARIKQIGFLKRAVWSFNYRFATNFVKLQSCGIRPSRRVSIGGRGYNMKFGVSTMRFWVSYDFWSGEKGFMVIFLYIFRVMWDYLWWRIQEKKGKGMTEIISQKIISNCLKILMHSIIKANTFK